MNPSFSSLEQARNTLIDLALRFGPRMLAVGDYVRATGEVNREVLAALREREISIPVPQREVRLIEAAAP